MKTNEDKKMRPKPTLTIHIAVVWREYDVLSQFIVREIFVSI
jgi:hypothetical protein